jgi:hypothetical protein
MHPLPMRGAHSLKKNDRSILFSLKKKKDRFAA